MEIKVGDYVRTKKGLIGKIYNINEFREPSVMYAIDFTKADDFVFMGENNFKSSPNIIDLIEVGDYVNGRKVSKINLDRTLNKEKCILCADTDYDCLETIYTNKDIKSIVTKEQFSQMEYKIND